MTPPGAGEMPSAKMRQDSSTDHQSTLLGRLGTISDPAAQTAAMGEIAVQLNSGKLSWKTEEEKDKFHQQAGPVFAGLAAKAIILPGGSNVIGAGGGLKPAFIVVGVGLALIERVTTLFRTD